MAVAMLAAASAYVAEVDVTERRVFLPNLVGYAFRATGAGSGGSLSGLDGVFSYAHGSESLSDGGDSVVESFALAPALDVRVGRFTIGGAVLVAQSTNTYGSSSFHGVLTSRRIGLEPRFGVLVPIARGLALWPVAKLDLAFGRATIEGMPGGFSTSSTSIAMLADVLFVVSVGSRFFATLGPSGGWVTTISTNQASQVTRSSTFRLGVGLGVGLAF